MPTMHNFKKPLERFKKEDCLNIIENGARSLTASWKGLNSEVVIQAIVNYLSETNSSYRIIRT